MWRETEVSANYVFGNMLLSAAAFFGFALLAMLPIRRFGRRMPSIFAVPVLSAGGLTIFLAWAFSGIGGLALDIIRHMVLPVATLTLISFAGTMLLT